MKPTSQRVRSRRLVAGWAACGLALFCGALSLAEEGAAPRPRLVIENAEIDLGAVREGDELIAEFQLRNAGEALLAILSAKPS